MKNIQIIPLFLSVLMLSSCVTKDMWKESSYNETIKSFLMTDSGEKLVVISKNYHYIFTLSNDLKHILLSSKRELLKPSFYHFRVDNNDNISGKYILNYFNKSKNQAKEFQSLGFKNKKLQNKESSLYTFQGKLQGKRYLANKVISSSQTFNKDYHVRIKEETSIISKIGKTLATPVTAAVDGVLIIGGAVLVSIFVTVSDKDAFK